jgi:hypothetical protein
MIYSLSNVADDLAVRHGLPRTKVKAFMRSAVAMITQHLIEGSEVRLSGLGTLRVRDPFELPRWIIKQAEEGERIDRANGRRRRSTWLRASKLAENYNKFRGYQCEDCGYRPERDRKLPRAEAAIGMMEVHHEARRIRDGWAVIKLTDLKVLCPTCHRRRDLIALSIGPKGGADLRR